jgi:c-di-GMP-binding flagellar brake protein YcgR
MNNDSQPEKTVQRIRFVPIQLGADLLIQLPNEHTRFRATLVGMKIDEYLIIQMPPVPGITSQLKKGDAIVKRYVMNGCIYGFASSILNTVSSPALICFTAYPEYVEMVNMRRERRLDCFFPASGKVNALVLNGAILDICSDGCRLVLDEESSCVYMKSGRVGDKITIVTSAIGNSPTGGEIKTVLNEVGRISLGIEFIELGDTNKENIAHLIHMAMKLQL